MIVNVKNYYFSYILIYIFFIVFSVQSENIISVSEATIHTNQIFNLNISSSNSDSIFGFQFDVVIPSEILYLDSIQTSNRFRDHQLSIQQVDSTIYRAICFSPSNSAFNDSTGWLIKMSLQSRTMTGQFPILLNNAILVGTNSTNILDSVKQGTITIQPVAQLSDNHEDNRNNLNIIVYPNPSNSGIEVKFLNKQIQSLKFILINNLGQKVIEYPEKIYSQGWNRIRIPTKNMSSGLYFVTMLDDQQIYNFKIMVLK